jgi:acetyl-CoA C-acetyltransferase
LDDGPGTFKPDKLASLRTPFRPENGRVTAATSSQLTDGAAALLLMSSAEAGRVGITAPLAKIISWADSALLDAMEFPVAPIDAIKTALSKANLSVEEVDLFEINEAFAVVPMAFMADLNIGLEKVNVLGGALALGHPLGASGARIVGTLITALRCKKKRIGCAAICNGGGGATALILELLLQ